MITYSLSLMLYLFLFQAGGGGGFFFQLSLTIIALLLLVSIFRAMRPEASVKLHWYHHFEDLQLSSQEFYQVIEKALTEMQMPGLIIHRINHYESGVLSTQRQYLRVSRKDVLYDICAAPFGYGFFVSYWQAETADVGKRIARGIPFVGNSLEQLFYPKTYYHVDTEEMFKNCIHHNVMATIDGITKEKGIRGLTELERKPIESKR